MTSREILQRGFICGLSVSQGKYNKLWEINMKSAISILKKPPHLGRED